MSNLIDLVKDVAPANVGTQERRRPGRMANPSPELIALMRKPTAEARQQLAIYDAPNFVLPQQTARPRVDPMHSLRVGVAVCICIGVWGGVFTGMMMAWG